MGCHPVLRAQGRPSLPVADGRRRHLRVRAGRGRQARGAGRNRRQSGQGYRDLPRADDPAAGCSPRGAARGRVAGRCTCRSGRAHRGEVARESAHCFRDSVRSGECPSQPLVRCTRRILAGGRPLFTTDTAYPVLTRGKPNTVSMLLRRAATPKPPATAGRPLEKTYWKATLVGTRAVAAADPKREPHLVLEPGGKVAGSDGCNRLVGSYELTGETISFGRMAGTMMACPDRARPTARSGRHWRTPGGGRSQATASSSSTRPVRGWRDSRAATNSRPRSDAAPLFVVEPSLVAL